MHFEWDAKKRLANIDKHNIDFRRALEIFRDENAVTWQSNVESGEDRLVTVAPLDGVIIAVIHVRRGHAIRIISARRARPYERTLYERGHR